MILVLAAAACLAVSDGQGNTTLTCPDGRRGYLYTDAGGATAGMLGAEPYQPPTAQVRPLPGGGLQSSYLPAPDLALSPAPVAPAAPPPPELPSLSPADPQLPASR